MAFLNCVGGAAWQCWILQLASWCCIGWAMECGRPNKFPVEDEGLGLWSRRGLRRSEKEGEQESLAGWWYSK